MEIQLQLILIAYFVLILDCNSGWTLVQSYNPIADQVVTSNANNAGGMRKNTFNKIMEEELHTAQYRNVNKHINLYKRSNAGKDVVVKREIHEQKSNSSSREFFGSKEFDTLYDKGKDALKAAAREHFRKTLNQTLEKKNEELAEKDDQLNQERTKEDFNRVICAIMLIRWHVVEEFKNNIHHENPFQMSNEKNESIILWTEYIERGRSEAASLLRESLGHDHKNIEKFAFSMIKMYRLCDAYMRTIPEAMNIILDKYKAKLRPVNEMLELYATRGPCHQFLMEDMMYVNILLRARGVHGIEWRWVDEKIGFVKPEAPSMESCVNPYTTVKPLMQ